jgi:Icc-related predicted phosphoesterase
MKILITGDIHNEFGKLNELINKKKPDITICCGDFGYWPKVPWGTPLENIKTQGSKVLWCDGNHEDHWSLRDRKKDEMVPNVIYMPRGSCYKLPDGRNIMFFGGADSIDKNLRKVGVDWFPEEVATQKEVYDLPDVKVDIMITHTCPECVERDMIPYNQEKLGDPTPKALQYLKEKYNPPLWYYGHWHIYKEIDHFGTHFTALGTCSYSHHRWWIWLPERN